MPLEADVLTPEALDFAAQLHRSFNPERLRLLQDRSRRQARIDGGELPDFVPNPIESRDPAWRVAPAPADFDDRRVEITGPAEPKMMINALNSGASVFMCDFEDALSPTWENIVTACARCNLTKGGRTPHEAHMHPRLKPRRPSAYELQDRGRRFPPHHLHESWLDYLYWDVVLEA